MIQVVAFVISCCSVCFATIALIINIINYRTMMSKEDKKLYKKRMKENKEWYKKIKENEKASKK